MGLGTIKFGFVQSWLVKVSREKFYHWILFQDVEWGFCFDVHLNAFFPILVILHFLQLFVYHTLIGEITTTGEEVINTYFLCSMHFFQKVTGSCQHYWAIQCGWYVA